MSVQVHGLHIAAEQVPHTQEATVDIGSTFSQVSTLELPDFPCERILLLYLHLQIVQNGLLSDMTVWF